MKILKELESKLENKLKQEDIEIVLKELEKILENKKSEVSKIKGEPYMYITGLHKTLDIVGV